MICMLFQSSPGAYTPLAQLYYKLYQAWPWRRLGRAGLGASLFWLLLPL